MVGRVLFSWSVRLVWRYEALLALVRRDPAAKSQSSIPFSLE